MSAKTRKPLTELRDADITRVDAVKGAANGTRFLIAKAAADGPAGIVSPDEVRELIADPPPPGDTFVDAAGQVLKAEAVEIAKVYGSVADLPQAVRDKYDAKGQRTFLAAFNNALSEYKGDEQRAFATAHAAAQKTGEVKKESAMPAPADQSPAGAAGTTLKEARAVLKRAKVAKKTRRLQKRALLARANELAPLKKGTLHALADAHEAVLGALKDQEDPETAKRLQSLADEIASCMSDHAMSESGTAEDEMDAAEGTDEAEAVVKTAKPVTLKKARAEAKAARIAKRALKDQIAAARARRTLAKLSRRSPAHDQQPPASATPAADLSAVAKSADQQVEDTIELIRKAVGSVVSKDIEAIRGELTQQSEQLAKIAKVPLPGGPRVILDRDGSIVAAGDGEQGLSFEQAALAKVAERYPVGSIEREALSKAAATEAIKELMQARI